MLPGKKYTPDDVLRLVWHRRWLLLVPCAIAAAAVAIYSWTLPDRYSSETVILVVPQRVPESYVRSTVTTRIEDRLQSISPQILSRTRLERIIRDLNLYTDARRLRPMEEVVAAMRRDVTVQVVKGDAFRVEYEGEKPAVVADVANRLASLFIEENLRDREVVAEGTNHFLEAQLDDARGRLIAHEQKLEAYRTQHAGELPSQLETNLQVIQNTQLQIQSLVDSISRDRDRRFMLERGLADLSRADTDLAAVTFPSRGSAADEADPVLSAAGQLEVARGQLREMESRLTPEHPDVGRAKRLIGELEAKAGAEHTQSAAAPAPRGVLDPASRTRQTRFRQLQEETENLDRQLNAKQAQEQRLRATVAAYQARVEAAPSRETEMTQLMRDYTTLQALYTSLLQKKEDSKMSANLERQQIGEQFKLLDRAVPAVRPFSPNRLRLIIIAALAGLGLGAGLAAVSEYRDTGLRTDEDVTRLLKTLVLATVPLMHTSAEERRINRVSWLVNVGCAAAVLVSAAVVTWTVLGRPGL